MTDQRAEELELPDLPTGWRWEPLEALKDSDRNAMTDGPFGSKLKTSDYVDAGVRVIRLGNVGLGEFKDDDRAYISERKYADLRKHEVLAHDLVIAALAEPVGRAAMVPEHVGRAIVKADCVRFKPGRRVDVRYLMYALNSPQGLARAEALSHGVGRLRINMGNMRELPVPVAPIEQQRRIVAKIEALTQKSRRAKEALDAIPPLLERFRQSVLASAFRGDLTKDWRAKHPDIEPAEALLKRIRTERRTRWEQAELAKLKAKPKPPPDDRWKQKYEEPEPLDAEGLPELPEGWCWVAAEEVTTLVTGGTPPGDEKGCYGGDVPFLKPTDLAAGRDVRLARQYLTQRGASFVDTLPANSVLITCIGATIGKSGLCRVPSATNQQINSMVPSVGIDAEYLYWYVVSPVSQSWIVANASATTLPILNKGRLARMPVAVAPEEEQGAVRELIGKLDECQTKAGAELGVARERADAIDASILAKAFRGELTNGASRE